MALEHDNGTRAAIDGHELDDSPWATTTYKFEELYHQRENQEHKGQKPYSCVYLWYSTIAAILRIHLIAVDQGGPEDRNGPVKITKSSNCKHSNGCSPSRSQLGVEKRKAGTDTTSTHESQIKTIR